ncbi:ABC transporter permease [Terracidiphilus gabretensis]|uniref:ABC transporter permease n=1 Tax=Terracidiphilus gabretensis TaxID=1577687 RepID=UPI00071B2189|nr:ABC transporter permease [Terracidiphilus gabretensis]
MEWIRVLLNSFVSLFRGKELDARLDEELGAHVDLAVAENVRHGMTEGDARTAALRAFGGVTQTRERYRVQRGLPWITTAAQDVRFGMRMMAKNPGFTAIAVLTLALGIGGNTAIFSIVNGVLLNPLPFPHAEQLVELNESKPDFPRGSIPYPNFLDWQRENHSFSSIAITRGYVFSLTGRGDAEQVQSEFISTDFFSVLGLHPLIGRTFTAAEEQSGAAPVALISEGLWKRKFDGANNVLGQAITLDGHNYTIVGVIPSGFHLSFANFTERDVYVPIRQWINPYLMRRSAGLAIHGIARLKPGVTLQQASADMDEVTRNLAVAYPDANQGTGASIIPLKEEMVGDVRPFLLVLMGAVGFVLLIACVNVASLLLARSAARGREFAVCAALGASRARVIRQLLTESLLLGILAGDISLVPAVWGTHAALRWLPAVLPRAEEVGLDFRVLAFTMTISLLTSTLFGLAPALRTSQANPQMALKEGGRGSNGPRQRTLGTFVVVEMAIALVLLTGAGLMIRSLVELWNVDPGFNPHNVLTFGMSLPTSMADASPDKIRATFRALDESLASTPGIKAVSPVWGALPMAGDDQRLFWLDGQPKPASDHDMDWAIDYIEQPDYLRVMQIPLKRGRFFSRQDYEHSPLVAVVDDVFANKYFSGQDVIGKRIRMSDSGSVVEIVGLVPHVNQWGLDTDDTQSLRAELYLPCMQMPENFLNVMRTGSGMVVRYEGSLEAVSAALLRTSRQISLEQVIAGYQTMDSVLSDSLASRRFAMILLGTFAALAVMLASIGIYGVMAYLVAQRTQEMGIRMALGAKRSDVLLLIFRHCARLTLLGVAIGVMSAIGLTRLMTSLLFHVSPGDPGILAGVAVLLTLVAMAACILPARRAASIEPMQALRTE